MKYFILSKFFNSCCFFLNTNSLFYNKKIRYEKITTIRFDSYEYSFSERREQNIRRIGKVLIYIGQLNNKIKELHENNKQLIERLHTIEKNLEYKLE